MDALLYAEIYLICLVVTGFLLYWTVKSYSRSSSEQWLKRLLVVFLLNYLSNLLFTVFNRVWIVEPLAEPLSYGLKTAYFLTLALGVFSWCGYAEAELQSKALERGRSRAAALVLLAIALLIPVVNLFCHWMFDFDEALRYRRHVMFRVEMWYLFAAPLICSWRLLRRARGESDPAHRSHLWLTASFPLCMLAAVILSYAGEAVPVICVCVMVELLCIYIGTMQRQVSLDKLTQVNNRQNLFGFLSYKLKNHSGDLFLLMIDLDRFKQINDIYGHLEGDRALMLLSGALKRSCGDLQPRPYIARYGGDEFIVVMEGSESGADALCGEIRRQIELVNEKSDTFRLSVSIGVSRWEEGMDNKALIAAADEKLYELKKARK